MVPVVAVKCEAEIDKVIRHAWAPAMLDKYDNGLAHFLSYCDEMEVPTSFRLPASEFLLCAFAASFAGSLASSTVENKLNGVRAWHIINNVEYKGSLRLNYVMKGVANLAPDALPPRPPITLEMLRLLYDHLDLSGPFDAAVFCAAVVAFWCQCRLGELFSTTERSFNPKLIPSVSDLAPPCTTAGSRLLRLPCTKTKRTRGESTFLSKQKGFSDPVDAVDHHLSANQLQASDPLFSYCTANGGLLALTKRKFMARCNQVWGSFALPRSTGHCFRIGGTTELLLAGVPPDVVKMMGRWSSDAFLRYWRSLHRIAPLHSELLDI
ncbi:hypothetical protein DFH07DRAFT_746906 [Mycena maculata]|uniref:DNA breaking-rejoining enzyme n=1 Tax=Mycena maculata TaxID=230809 RepID=A0AAD7IRM3_9AGAR|nr:hypothetical protein DFH07DRAFT_746906 [Mycena maculata]